MKIKENIRSVRKYDKISRKKFDASKEPLVCYILSDAK